MAIADRPQQFDASEAAKQCAALAADVEQGPYTEPLGDCLPVIYQSVRDNFTSSATPDDVSWPARKIEGDGHPLLIDTGAMLQAAVGSGSGRVQEVGSFDLAVGVDGSVIPYAATHNFGSKNMPSREYMGISEEHEDECERIIADFVMQEILG